MTALVNIYNGLGSYRKILGAYAVRKIGSCDVIDLLNGSKKKEAKEDVSSFEIVGRRRGRNEEQKYTWGRYY